MNKCTCLQNGIHTDITLLFLQTVLGGIMSVEASYIPIIVC